MKLWHFYKILVLSKKWVHVPLGYVKLMVDRLLFKFLSDIFPFYFSTSTVLFLYLFLFYFLIVEFERVMFWWSMLLDNGLTHQITVPFGAFCELCGHYEDQNCRSVQRGFPPRSSVFSSQGKTNRTFHEKVTKITSETRVSYIQFNNKKIRRLSTHPN